MKIGLVLSATPGYSETFFNSKIKGLQASGFKVVLFVQKKQKGFNLCEVREQLQFKTKKPLLFSINLCKTFFLVLLSFRKVYRFITVEKKANKTLKDILKNILLNIHILRESDLDWLHFGFATTALGKENIPKSLGAKMAVSFRGFDIDVYPLKHIGCYDKLWKNVDKVHSISNYLYEKAVTLGLSKDVSHQIITPAIDTDLFKPSQEVLEKEQLRILTVGRLHWIKNYNEILLALNIVKNKGLSFSYTIVGEGNDYEKLAYLVYELGLKDVVNFVGKKTKEEVLKLYDVNDIYIQYSYSEGFCNAVLEAQSTSLLTIVSNSGALSENVLHNQTGWVVPKLNPQALSDKILEVINLPTSEKERIINNARARVQKEFNIEKQQKEFVNFYKEK